MKSPSSTTCEPPRTTCDPLRGVDRIWVGSGARVCSQSSSTHASAAPKKARRSSATKVEASAGNGSVPGAEQSACGQNETAYPCSRLGQKACVVFVQNQLSKFPCDAQASRKLRRVSAHPR